MNQSLFRRAMRKKDWSRFFLFVERTMTRANGYNLLKLIRLSCNNWKVLIKLFLKYKELLWNQSLSIPYCCACRPTQCSLSSAQILLLHGVSKFHWERSRLQQYFSLNPCEQDISFWLQHEKLKFAGNSMVT